MDRTPEGDKRGRPVVDRDLAKEGMRRMILGGVLALFVSSVIFASQMPLPLADLRPSGVSASAARARELTPTLPLRPERPDYVTPTPTPTLPKGQDPDGGYGDEFFFTPTSTPTSLPTSWRRVRGG